MRFNTIILFRYYPLPESMDMDHQWWWTERYPHSLFGQQKHVVTALGTKNLVLLQGCSNPITDKW